MVLRSPSELGREQTKPVLPRPLARLPWLYGVTIVICAGYPCLGQAAGSIYTGDTSVSLDYTPVPSNLTSADLLHISISVDNSDPITVTMDTGSVGILLGTAVWTPAAGDEDLGPGTLTYTSSNNVESGEYYLEKVTLEDASGRPVAIAQVPVLSVRLKCDLDGQHCNTNPGTEMMGVGFARETNDQPSGTPDKNPFLNLTSIVDSSGNFVPVPAGFNPGYVISTTGVQLGLTATNTNGATAIKLLQDPTYSVAGHTEWQAVPVTFIVNGNSVTGTILVDTGVTTSYTKTTVGDFTAGKFLPSDTTIGVSFTGNGGPSLAEYNLINDDSADPLSPKDGVFVSHYDPADPVPAPSLNTSISLLNGVDIYYDPINGYYGLIDNGQVSQSFLTITPGMILEGPVSLPGGFDTSLPIVLQADTALQSSGAVALRGTVTGPGQLEVDQGTISLLGANSYTGGTAVDGGVLGVTSDAALGADGTSVSLSGGTLRALDNLVSPRPIMLTGYGGIIDTNGQNVTLTGAINGSGGLGVVGGGTLTLTGSNNYAGSTAVASAVLAVGSDPALGAPGTALTLQDGTLQAVASFTSPRPVLLADNGGTIDTNGQKIALEGPIGGQGTLAVNGGGSLRLDGANGFDGGVSATDVTLAINSDAALGASDVPLTLSAATLLAEQSLAVTRPIQIATGSIVDTGGNTVTLAGPISGGGGLTIDGDGILALTSANSFTGGVNVNMGTLAVTGDAALGDPSNNVTLTNATFAALSSFSSARAIAINGSSAIDLSGNAVTLSGPITGGTLQVGGGGTLLLTGTNSFTGGLYATGATVAVGADQALGASGGTVNLGGATLQAIASFASNRPISIGNDGATLDDGGNAVLLTGQVSGPGTLTKIGSGSLTLGNMAVSLGGLVAQSGTLMIGGAVGAGSLTVATGATLSGTGYIAAPTTVAGTLEPGASLGTLTFAQSVAMLPSATLALNIDGPGLGSGPGNHSVVAITGNGSFTAAGTLMPILQGYSSGDASLGAPPLGTTISAVAAPAGIAGSFDALSQPAGLAPGTRFDTLYTHTTISLVVTPADYSDLSAAGLTETANERAVGAAIDAIRPTPGARIEGETAELLDALYPLPAQAIAPTLNTLGSEIYGNALFTGLDAQRLVLGAVDDQMATLRGGTPATTAQIATLGDRGTIWVRGLGEWQDLDSDDSASGAKAALGGVTVGADARIADTAAVAGFAVGYTGGDINNGADANDNVQALDLIGYASWQRGLVFVNGTFGGSATEDSVQRNLPLLDEISSGTAHSDGVFGEGRVGLAIPLGNTRFEPSVAFLGQTLGRSSLTEAVTNTGALAIAGDSVTGLQSEVGVSVNHSLPFAGHPVTLAGRLGWAHQFADTSTQTDASFITFGGTTFTNGTPQIGRDGLLSGASVTAALSPGLAVYASYDSDLQMRETEQSVTAGMRLLW